MIKQVFCGVLFTILSSCTTNVKSDVGSANLDMSTYSQSDIGFFTVKQVYNNSVLESDNPEEAIRIYTENNKLFLSIDMEAMKIVGELLPITEDLSNDESIVTRIFVMKQPNEADFSDDSIPVKLCIYSIDEKNEFSLLVHFKTDGVITYVGEVHE